MFQVIFKAKSMRQTLEPVASFRLAGHTLYVNGQDELAATLNGSIWTYASREYERLEAQGMLYVHFMDRYDQRVAVLGPHGSFHVLETYVFAGRHLIASYAARLDMWRVQGTSDCWPTLLITSAW